MEASFKLGMDKFDDSFLNKIKEIFSKNAIIEIKISDGMDETEYLLSTEANRESLKKSLEQLSKKEFITVDEKDLRI